MISLSSTTAPIAGRPPRQLLVLAGDAYGGHGGIATFNRGFLGAIAAMDEVGSITVLPRLAGTEERPPAKVRQLNTAAGGVSTYLSVLLQTIANGGFDLILCGHINLLPFARLAQLRCRCPLALVVHGIDVDEADGRFGLRFLTRRVDRVISVSNLTLGRLLAWAPLKGGRTSVLPNCVDLDRFTPGPKPAELLERYGLRGKRVLMTFGRLVGRDRHKGFDEVLKALPRLLALYPDLVYLVAGDGPDRRRLEGKARKLGISGSVIFAGRIAEEEKVDHYRLADLYVMPSRGEGFGIVILEALACGIPVIGSRVDGTREALLDGKLGRLVNPDRPDELVAAIECSLAEAIPGRPDGIETFSAEAFAERTRGILRELLANR